MVYQPAQVMPVGPNWTAGCKFEEEKYNREGGWNDWHFVDITNPSGNGKNFIWKNRAGVEWDLIAKFNQSGMIEAFDVCKNCPYFDMYEPPYPHKVARLKYGPNGQLEGIYGPGYEFYAFVMNFSH